MQNSELPFVSQGRWAGVGWGRASHTEKLKVGGVVPICKTDSRSTSVHECSVCHYFLTVSTSYLINI